VNTGNETEEATRDMRKKREHGKWDRRDNTENETEETTRKMGQNRQNR
jgi:hypothetical protein